MIANMMLPVLLALCLWHVSFAAPITTSCSTPHDLHLPSTFPLRDTKAATDCAVPTHFALFGYSLDGTIINQPYFTHGIPHNITAGTSTDATTNITNSYGSYAYSIGPAGHIFAFIDGRVGFMSLNLRPNSNKEITYFFFDSWSDYWGVNTAAVRGSKPHDPIPTCEVVPWYNVLRCSLDGVALQFGYCGKEVEYSEAGWDAETVVWGTNVTGVCKEVVLRAEEVPFDYGHSLPGPFCEANSNAVGCAAA